MSGATVAAMIRRWWLEVLIVAAWLGAAVLAQMTTRTLELLAGTIVLSGFWFGSVLVADLRSAALEGERDYAAEVARSIPLPPNLSREEEQILEGYRERVARAILAHGSDA